MFSGVAGLEEGLQEGAFHHRNLDQLSSGWREKQLHLLSPVVLSPLAPPKKLDSFEISPTFLIIPRTLRYQTVSTLVFGLRFECLSGPGILARDGRVYCHHRGKWFRLLAWCKASTDRWPCRIADQRFIIKTSDSCRYDLRSRPMMRVLRVWCSAPTDFVFCLSEHQTNEVWMLPVGVYHHQGKWFPLVTLLRTEDPANEESL